MTDDRMRELFREMRDEAVPPDSLARVRMRVAERTAAAPRRGWWWLASLAAVALLVLVIAVSRKPVAPTVAVVPKPVEAPKVVESRVIPEAPVVRPVRAPRRRAAPVAKPAVSGAVAIRIETPDPDVVIILLGEGE